MTIRGFLYRFHYVVSVVFCMLYLLVFAGIYAAWSYGVQDTLDHSVVKKTKQVSTLKNTIAQMLRKTNQKTTGAFKRSDFVSSHDMVLNLRRIMRAQGGVTLIDLRQDKPQVLPLRSVFSEVIHGKGIQHVVVYHYQLKVLVNYLSFLKMLKALQGNQDLYWKRIEYNANQYPEAVATLQFYSLYGGE